MMTKWRPRFFVGGLMAAMLVLPTVSQAGRGGGRDEGKGGREMRMVEGLDLTTEQQEKLKAIRAEFRSGMPAKKEAMKAARKDLQIALQGTASDDELRMKFAELQQKQDEFGKARFDKILKIRALLTPEQRAKFRGFDRHHGESGE